MATQRSTSNKIQQIVQLATTVFRSNGVGEPNSTDLERLKQLVNTLTAEDVNISTALATKRWDYPPYVQDSPAACVDVYECPSFSIGIFLLKPNKSMPLHDHPGMHGIMKMLFGSMTITSYSKCLAKTTTKLPSAEFLAEQVFKVKLTSVSEPCCLYPTVGNIHEIKAEDEPVAFLDILAPPYNPSEGRDCNYYYRQPRDTGSENLAYLKVGPNPNWFSCIPLKHDGFDLN